jgi:hypothetical protein
MAHYPPIMLKIWWAPLRPLYLTKQGIISWWLGKSRQSRTITLNGWVPSTDRHWVSLSMATLCRFRGLS